MEHTRFVGLDIHKERCSVVIGVAICSVQHLGTAINTQSQRDGLHYICRSAAKLRSCRIVANQTGISCLLFHLTLGPRGVPTARVFHFPNLAAADLWPRHGQRSCRKCLNPSRLEKSLLHGQSEQAESSNHPGES
jgi:hypothetical protein